MGRPGKVFISYRREGGAELARNVRDALRRRGFEVFMDVEDLRGGPFDAALYQQIDDATDVVVILTPGSLDRSLDDPKDWLRLEIAHALQRHKHVVPVLGGRFAWPERPLPDDLAPLKILNGLPVSHDYFEASMDRLKKYLVGPSRRQAGRTRRLALASIVAVGAVAIALMAWLYNGRPVTTPTSSADQPDAGSTATAPEATNDDGCDPTEPQVAAAGAPMRPIPDNLWTPPSPPTHENYILLVSDPGDYIGGGKTYVYTPTDARISVKATRCQLDVSVEGDENWSGTFRTMVGLHRLQQGYYRDLKRHPFHNPVRGGLSWSGEGRGCNELTGWFAIDRIEFTNEKPRALDLRFEQRCESQPAALHGSIRWTW
jgi:hypothetical protein